MLGTLSFDRARFNMIEQQVRPWEVLDPRVLDVLGEVLREDFVPPRHRKLAFADLAIPLEHGEFMMKPVVEGRMLQALGLHPDDEVLEIGTGSGFITACLSKLARQVTSLEIHGDLAERAKSRVGAIGIRNARILHQDVYADFRPELSFDAIAVTGAVVQIPPQWRTWLKPGGRMFVISGRSPAMEATVVTRQSAESWEQTTVFETDIAYLRGAEPAPRFEF